MALLTFDGPNKLMICNPGVTALDVTIDIYSDWKEWALLGDNFKYDQAMRSTGGDPLPGSKALGSTYFLMNGWKIRPQEANHTLNVDGNMYCEDGTSPFTSTVGSWAVFVISTVSSLVDATVQQLPEIEQGMFQNQVCIDLIKGVPGSAYPIGTRQKPVNNLADAKAIAADRGFTELYIIGNITINAGESINGFNLIGTGPENTYTSLASGCTTSKTEFRNMSVSGRQNGETHYYDCDINTLLNVHCLFYQCRMIGPMEMHQSYGDTTVLFQCYSGDVSGAEFIVDMNNSPCHMSFNSFSGNMRIKNLNKVTAGVITINSVAGEIFIDNTCTTGRIQIHGSCEVTNNAAGTIVENDSIISALTTVITSGGTGGGLTLAEHNQLMSLQNALLAGDIIAVIDGVWDKVLPGTGGLTAKDYVVNKILSTNKFLGLSD
jgi:hypothetical protein